jgi:hypothetical protein
LQSKGRPMFHIIVVIFIHFYCNVQFCVGYSMGIWILLTSQHIISFNVTCFPKRLSTPNILYTVILQRFSKTADCLFTSKIFENHRFKNSCELLEDDSCSAIKQIQESIDAWINGRSNNLEHKSIELTFTIWNFHLMYEKTLSYWLEKS